MQFNLLQRYIFKELTKTFLFAVIILTLVFLLMLVMQVVYKYRNYVSLVQIFFILPQMLGRCAVFTIPLALLASITLLYGRMTADKEILVLRAAGVHLLRIFFPALVLASLLSIFCFYLNSEILPENQIQRQKIKQKTLEKLITINFSSGQTIVDFIPGIRIYYTKLEDGRFQDLIIQHYRDNKVMEEIIAESGSMSFHKEKKLLSFELFSGSIHHLNRDREATLSAKEERLFFERISVPLKMDFEVDSFRSYRAKYKKLFELVEGANQYKVEAEYSDTLVAKMENFYQKIPLMFFSSKDIYVAEKVAKSQIKKAKSSRRRYVKRNYSYTYEFYRRMADSLAPFIVVLIGAPLGVLISSNNRLTAFAISSLPVLLIYYPLQVLGTRLGGEMILDPLLAAWLPNVAAIFLGMILLLLVFRK